MANTFSHTRSPIPTKANAKQQHKTTTLVKGVIQVLHLNTVTVFPHSVHDDNVKHRNTLLCTIAESLDDERDEFDVAGLQ